MPNRVIYETARYFIFSGILKNMTMEDGKLFKLKVNNFNLYKSKIYNMEV